MNRAKLLDRVQTQVRALRTAWESYSELSRRLLLVGAALALGPYVCFALSLWFAGYTAMAGLVVFATSAHAWAASTMLLTWSSTVFIEAAYHTQQKEAVAHVQ